MRLTFLAFVFLTLSAVYRTIDATKSKTTVDVKKCLVWGPGLKGNFRVPARYFFIQVVDTNGNNFTDSIGEKPFSVSFYQSTGARTRIWSQTLDRHDGSYIVRYKIYGSYDDIMIGLEYNDKHVADSPYKLEGPIYQETCNCPGSLDDWLKVMQCPASYRQIKEDLSIFQVVDMEAVAAQAVARFNQRGSHSLCHYVVKDNKIYRKTYGQHVGFKMFMDSILLTLTRKVRLPDIELFVNLGDWPLEKRSVSEDPLPIFSWCGSEETRDIIMPTYDVTDSTLETMGRVSLELLSVQANTGPKWQNKSSVAFWRGRDSRNERLELVRMSRRNPDIIDAKLTNMFFFKHEEDLGELVKHISFFDFFKYKYQINIDGTVAAYRFPYLLGGDSLVLKQDSDYYEHFYKDLEPYKHYVPLKHDLSDLLKMIQWAKDHDEQAKQIALNGREFVRNHLMADNIFCYHVLLFQEYAKLLVKPPKVLKDMELVEQPSDHESQCNCRANKHGKAKEEL
ncbi:Protein O-glucosyltransferase 2 [Lamellibrachia satsuma]|nr:Protein O-glucosyltransferase 2 [Lamellibrachia satsuma]